MDGAELIATERERQVSEEGWTPEHDDAHDCDELRQAARCYLVEAHEGASSPMPSRWPWQARFWKPSDDPVHNLAKAGALIAAEIDRLNRASGV